MNQEQFQNINSQSVFKNGVQIVTMPLSKDAGGVRIREGANQYIFVNSKRPKAERSRIIRDLMQKPEKS